MDQYLSRQEIRRLVLSETGYTTDASLSQQILAQYNAWIDAAAQDVQTRSRWINLQRRCSLLVPKGAELVTYLDIERARWLTEHYPNNYHPLTYGTPVDTWQPADLNLADIKPVGPGGIIDCHMWDEEARRYFEIYKRVIPPRYDQDRLKDFIPERVLIDVAAGDTPAQIAADVTHEQGLIDQQVGRILYCEPRGDGVHFYPMGDKAYVVHFRYVISPSWGYHQQSPPNAPIDQLYSAVDALAIVFKVVANVYAFQQDMVQSARYDNDSPPYGKYQQRLRDLRAWQATAERIAIDDDATMDDGFDNPENYMPKWDLRPNMRGAP